jgi:hypothetical protein
MIVIEDITTRGVSASSSSYESIDWPLNTTYTSFSESWNDTTADSATPLTRYRTVTTETTYTPIDGTTTESYSTYDGYDEEMNPVTLTVTTAGYTTSSLTAGGRTTASTEATTTSSRTAGTTSHTTSTLTSETYSETASGTPDTTAMEYHAQVGFDLLVYTGTGPQPVTAGSRVDSTKFTRKVMASSAWSGSPAGPASTVFTITTGTHLSGTNRGYASSHDFTSVTVSSFHGGCLPPSSTSHTTRSAKTQTTVTSSTGPNTYTRNWNKTSSNTVSYADFTTTMHRSGSATGTHYEQDFTVGITTSSHTSSADWGGSSLSTSTGLGAGAHSTATVTRSNITYKTTVQTVAVYEQFPRATTFGEANRNGGVTAEINYLLSDINGWNPVSTQFSDAPVGLGLTASAARTVSGFPDWQAGVSTNAPAPYQQRTTFPKLTNSADTAPGIVTMIFGTDSVVSSTWTVTTTASTDPNTSSGAMSLATSGAAQTIQTTRNTQSWTTIGAVDAVVPAGVLVAFHDSGEDATYHSAPTRYQATFTKPVVLKCLEYIEGPCVLEIPQYISTSNTYGM